VHADFFSDAHHHTDREVILMTTMAATSYVGAVLAGLSGILAVFFCGITMSHYTWHSISASARVMSVHNFRVLCSLSEVFLFIYAGLDISAKLTARLGHDAAFMRAVVNLALALVALVAIVRALFVALAVAIVNLWRSYKFTLREAVIMWYGGLVRGSVTTALAYSYLYTETRSAPGDEVVLLASVLVVVVSTVLVGGLSQEFMACVTLPTAQSRLIEINMLPGMNHEDDNSVNSAAVRVAASCLLGPVHACYTCTLLWRGPRWSPAMAQQ
jgi:solute carrier family 9 (sodium/hydrogen exchanger), member 8